MNTLSLPVFQYFNLSRCLSLVSAFLVYVSSTPLSAEVAIAPHRAAYTFELKDTERGSRVTGATGLMVYGWGETCDGWTINQQFYLNIFQIDGITTQFVSHSSTWESKDGKRLRFNIKRERDSETLEEIRGEGMLEEQNGAGIANFELPKPLQLKLPEGTVFPTTHTIRLIRRAMDGARTDRQLVFDGSELKPATIVSAFILPPEKAAKPGPKINPSALAKNLRKIYLAFFQPSQEREEPEFEMSIELQDNGIILSLILDYGEYAVRGILERLELSKKPDCD